MFGWIFMTATVLLLPVVMLFVGIKFGKSAPKKINMTFGYRTARSMKSTEAWQYAHKFIGNLWKKLGVIMLFVTLLYGAVSFGFDEDALYIGGLVMTCAQLAVLVMTIFPTERALKENFDDFGLPKLPKEETEV